MIPRLAQRTRFAAVALIATAVLGLTACTGGATGTSGGDVATLDKGLSGSIDDAVASAMELSGSSEAVVGVWSGDDAYVRGFGDGVDGSTRIRGAQATQPVMCALLLDLVEDGTVKLGRAVEKDLERQSGIEGITYGQLCDMRSGLADYKDGFADIFVNNPTRPWPEQELIAQGLTRSPLSWPGLDVHISDTNALVLSRAIHVKTGDDMSELLKNRVFGPAGMGSSYFPAPTSTTADDALSGLAYPSSGGKPVCDAGPVEKLEVSPSMLGGAGGTVTTVTDLKNFYARYLDGAFGGEAGKQVTETIPVKNPERDEEGNPTSEVDTESGDQWGFGVEKVGPLYGRSGAITGTLTAAYHDPESDFSVVVALNNSSAGAGFAKSLAFQIAALSSEAGAAPEIPWTVDYQAERLRNAAVCQ